MTDLKLLPGVPENYVRARFGRSPGNKLSGGKFTSEESSAALAANGFAWFHDRPELLPPLPGLPTNFRAERVEIEYKAAFPWGRGHHPWLDAAVFDERCIIGIESKRYEPFRDKRMVAFSDTYERQDWGAAMEPFVQAKSQMKLGQLKFQFLDAAQLVKHAFGLATEARRVDRTPTLFYLFAEPAERNGRRIDDAAKHAHRDEIAAFAKVVDGAAVSFLAASYREWIEGWIGAPDEVQRHGQALLERFAP